MSNQPTILISGASSGFGLETAKAFINEGYRVFGTSRKAIPSPVDGMEMLTLDVGDEQSVKDCVATLLNKAGRCDVLVNNAGFVVNGFAEETDIDQVESIFQTNFVGLVRLTNAILPTMRSQRCGKIINISSIAGLMGVPYRGFYAASKFAVEGYSESLRTELLHFNIYVSLIEPGFFKTNIDNASILATTPIADYDKHRNKVHNYFTKGVRDGGNPANVAKLIAKVAQKKTPKLRYRIGRESKIMPIIKAILPAKLIEKATLKYFNLK
ncbi:MAG: SDR family NAD(P)-dependent oxidoreductase [Phycisphaerae bacterium]|nr:SDR family NAD(P)-dependent oxidoreductase [Phycisphaerae bacterium]